MSAGYSSLCCLEHLALCDGVSDAAALKGLARREHRKGSFSLVKYPHLLATAWNVLPLVLEAIPIKCVPSEGQIQVLQLTAPGNHDAIAYDTA